MVAQLQIYNPFAWNLFPKVSAPTIDLHLHMYNEAFLDHPI